MLTIQELNQFNQSILLLDVNNPVVQRFLNKNMIEPCWSFLKLKEAMKELMTIMEKIDNISDKKEQHAILLKTLYSEYWFKRLDCNPKDETHQDLCIKQLLEGVFPLIKSLMSIGYKNDYFCTNSRHNHDDYLQGFGPISIHIGRTGELWIKDGTHRISILLALGHKTLPVYVHQRNDNWIKIKAQVQKNPIKNKPYLTHPDITTSPAETHIDSTLRSIKTATEGKRILLVIDNDGMPFDKIAKYIMLHDDSDNCYLKLAVGKGELSIKTLTEERKKMISKIKWDYIITMFYGWLSAWDFLDKLRIKNKILCVYDFYWNIEPKYRGYFEQKLLKTDYVLGSSPELVNLLDASCKKLQLKIPVGSCFDGIDTEQFYFSNFTPKKKLTIGIMGDNLSYFAKKYDNKGFSIFEKVVEKLDKDRFTFLVVEFSTDNIPYEKMREAFYSKIDIYLCLSETEGTATGVLESMSSGVYWLSTPCGLVEFILKIEPSLSSHIISRDLDQILKKLYNLYDNQEIIQPDNVLSRKTIEYFDWSVTCKQFYQIFQDNKQSIDFTDVETFKSLSKK